MELEQLNAKSPSIIHFTQALPSRKLLPVYGCWLLMMVATGIAAYLNEHSSSGLTDACVQGVFLGEFALATIIGGLAGRTWIAGWMLSACLVIFATFICYCVGEYGVRYYSPFARDATRLVLCSFWPMLMLGACAPMIAMRGLRGWSLTLKDDIAIPRQPSSVEDLFLLGIIVASCISIARWMDEFLPGVEPPAMFFVMGLFFGFSLLFVLPVVVLTFRVRNWLYRVLGWLGMTILVMAACLALTWIWSDSFDWWRELPYVAIGVGTSAVTMMVGGISLLVSGVKLTHFERTMQKCEIENADTAKAHRTRFRADRLQARVLSGIVVVGALITVSILNFANVKMRNFLRSVQTYNQTFPNQVTELTIRGDKVVGATLDPTSTDSSLDRYRGTPNELERVSLAGTKVTDAAVDKLANFTKLKHLDLSNTAITSEGIERLTCLGNLETLSLANTKVDFDVALRVCAELGVKNLDVSGTGIVDDQLSRTLQLDSIDSLKLGRNPVTDAGISRLLMNSKRLKKLDLSDTNIDGSGLASHNCPLALVLDGTKITDANLIQILRVPGFSELSIRSTTVTAAVLPNMIPIANFSLTLAEGNITEQDLINLLPGAQLKHLALNDKKFSGEFMRLGKFAYGSLDLSHSGVTDAALQKILRQSYLYFINLSHTNITDAALESLSCQEVDVRHTKVTPTGIRNALQIGRILIDHNQFTPEELVSLRNANVAIDGEKSDNGL